MKIVHAQPRQFVETGCFPETRLCFPAMALCATLLLVGCADRRTTTSDSQTTAAPVTTHPVAAPPATPSVQEAATRDKPPEAAGRVAAEDTSVSETRAVPGGRAAEGEVVTPVGREPVTEEKEVQRSDDARTPAQAGVEEEEDVSAALRREVAEIERQRARQQPRGWSP